MSERRPVCAQCIYWKVEQSAGQQSVGHCHRYPPAVVANPHSGTMAQKFPTTERGQWCGEWNGDDTQLVEIMRRAMLKRAGEAARGPGAG
jgi:hypothetical protein